MANLPLLDLLKKSEFLKEKTSQFKKTGRALIGGLVGSAKGAVVAALAGQYRQLFLVTATAKEAEILKKEIKALSGLPAEIFPPLDNLENADKELIGARLAVTGRLLSSRKALVIAPLRALRQKVLRHIAKLDLAEGKTFRLDSLIGRLIELGYKRFDIVGEKGEFCVRGGIVDIYPLNADLPVRIELLSDKIESLRAFDPYTQRSQKKLAEAEILSAKSGGEATIFEILPKDCLIVTDEMISLEKTAGDLEYDLSEIKKQKQIGLSAFLAPDEPEIFSPPLSYVNRLEELPRDAVAVSRHALRLKEADQKIQAIEGELRGGFVFEGKILLSDRELFGEELAVQPARRPAKEGVADELLSDLMVGDHVVHEHYGIGINRGMKMLEFEDFDQEYLLVEFAAGDKVYVPPAMLGLVEKYEGGRGGEPRLSRLASREWQNTRRRVKQSLKELTRELAQLYAAREKFEGYSFPADDLWQRELEATFPYEETPDQLKAIEAVKKDMQSLRPMDRLICGDVGYGKTEVAIRAAAKAAAAGKQVAILAPTTILVEQHYNNFRERFRQFPFVIEMLSRFRSRQEQKETVELLAAGTVDIIIGTHRLLSKDIKFKDIGLLIIDEEQKFGVAHKEKIKKLKQTVDVLTLSATPIPRTMYFSLSGLREMSPISTPPVDRSPIKTYVLPFSEAVVKEAIRKELDRGGQIYFVHNFVETIAGTALRIKKLVPEARLATAHGQMAEKTLEKTMLDFMGKKYDLLVCTSIIESGLDIPSVNTILIDQADRFGLSQLYQIRGRVGRSSAKAYAYLFYNPVRSMSDQAVERLKAIQEFTALGSGYKLAMKDLEIRGAGNLLGGEQSGHIYEVGFDLYCEMLEAAVKEIKGEKADSPREVEIDLKVEAFIPSAYITDDRQRIAVYHRMNLAGTAERIDEVRQELLDRFGPLPSQVETLLKVLKLKIKALKHGVKSIREQVKKIRIEWLTGRIRFLELAGEDKIKTASAGISQ